jgi:hypothetical protein
VQLAFVVPGAIIARFGWFGTSGVAVGSGPPGLQQAPIAHLQRGRNLTAHAGQAVTILISLPRLGGAAEPKELTAVAGDPQARSLHLLRIGRAEDVGLEVGGNTRAGRLLLVLPNP